MTWKHVDNCCFGIRRRLLFCRARQSHAMRAVSDGLTDAPAPVPESIQLRSECDTVYDRNGDIVEVMCCDYGFRSGTRRMYQEGFGEIPLSAWELGIENFRAELKALRRSVRFDEYRRISQQNPAQSPLGKLGYWIGGYVVGGLAKLDKALEDREIFEEIGPELIEAIEDSEDEENQACAEILAKIRLLKLDNAAIWQRERKREKAGGGIDTSLPVKGAYLLLCTALDVLYNNRPVQRFWFLEVIARMPYFSYISMLHLYESLGWWRAGAELRKVHFAEEWNELHHLQIMESLGGDRNWIDRFLAQHTAIIYYWVLLLFYLFSPENAYNFSELIEAHAVDTYGEFVDSNADMLKALPAPSVAAQYYVGNDIYMFDAFQTNKAVQPRRPQCSTLYDVFCNIRDDEMEHVNTMRACQDTSIASDLEQRRQPRTPEDD
ncbi:unnamed protein product [Ostreobium quekettii]|uniref:Ubiquinol oxidase n=1 Tax=Ostreobium quekettii TaxID=121088 RepID=A0A8S1IWZ8_9CHLO|nr:unnamed protein product [Ostreobium quekettii]